MNQLILTRQSGSTSQPAVRKAVNQIRRECIALEPGTLLGQEEDVLERYGISRPTLRQAAAMLSQEQLMEVRRGPGGGYFTRRPDISGVVHMAAIWLQLQHVDISEILLSTTTIREELAPLAAINISEEEREQLSKFLEDDRSIEDENYEFQTFLKAELVQNRMIGNFSRNRVLSLYMQISLDLVSGLSRGDDILFGHRERYLEWRHQRNRMLGAIIDGDAEIARLEAERCGTKLAKWVASDRPRNIPENERAD